MKPAIIVVKNKGCTKAIHQAVEMAQAAVGKFDVVGILEVKRGDKAELIREIKKLSTRKRFRYVLIYDPKEFVSNRQEYDVLCYRAEKECKVLIQSYQSR